MVFDCNRRPFSQADVNDLARDLSLSKKASELLACRLRLRYVFRDEVGSSHLRAREAGILNISALSEIFFAMTYKVY